MTKVGAISNVEISESGDIIVNVVVGPETTHDDIRFQTPSNRVWMVPEEGDFVEVREVGHNRYVAFHPHNPTNPIPSSLSEGDVAIQLDSDTLFSLSKQDDGTYDIKITCDGTVAVDANAIQLGSDGNREALATASHTHDYEDELDGGGTTTKTTQQPDSSGTTDKTEAE